MRISGEVSEYYYWSQEKCITQAQGDRHRCVITQLQFSRKSIPKTWHGQRKKDQSSDDDEAHGAGRYLEPMHTVKNVGRHWLSRSRRALAADCGRACEFRALGAPFEFAAEFVLVILPPEMEDPIAVLIPLLAVVQERMLERQPRQGAKIALDLRLVRVVAVAQAFPLFTPV